MVLLISLPANAQFQEWNINEVYSNGDGTIQYIELTTSASGQIQLSGQSLLSSSNTAGENTFTFPADLSGETAGATLLLASEGFLGLTGLEPDFTLPAGFVPLGGGSLNFGNGASILEFSREQLPLNGIQALGADLQPVTASPENFAGLSATVVADSNATFNTDTNVMNIPVLEAPGLGLANVSFAVDLESLVFSLLDNFYFYANGISAGNAPAQLQNGSVLHVPALEFGTEIFEFNISILSDDPITLGNPEILSVTSLPPEPEPEPEPEPDPVQASIERGRAQFMDLCTVCHGTDGQGTFQGPSLINSNVNTFDALRTKINNDMPRTNPAACVDSGNLSCATDAANFVLNVIQGGP